MEICSQCGKQIVPDGIGTGYAIDKQGNKHCYQCCGENDYRDLLAMKPGDKITLYYSKGKVVNWPGTLSITPTKTKGGYHNIAGVTESVWFTVQGNNFYGRQVGRNNELLHVRRIK